MLSFKFVTSAGGAAHYFENSDDYYTKNDHKGQWEGEGAKLLGLEGGVDSAVFKNLLEGRLPNGEQVRKGIPKTQGNGKVSKQRLGIDFTFSAPKSVSIAALVNGDMKIIQAHDEAVKAAIKLLESKAIARKKERGISFRQRTLNLTVATFRHDLSRTQDPQLHTHSVAMNLTQRDDGKWVALTNDEMLKSIKVVGAYYRAELAQRLEAMGYDIRATRNGFEMANVSDEAIKLFSKRSQQIEAILESKGLDRDKAGTQMKQAVTQATRPNKTDADREELRKEWIAVLEEAGIKLKKEGRYEEIITKVKEAAEEFGRAVVPQKIWEKFEGKTAKTTEEIARNSVDYAVEHLMERQGIFTMGELLERAYMRGLGVFSEIENEVEKAKKDGRIIAELPLYQSAKSFSKDKRAEEKDFQHDKFKHDTEEQKFTTSSWVAMTMVRTGKSQAEAEKIVADSIQNGRLVKTEERFTTGEMLASEKQILRMEEAGRGTIEPIKTAAEVEAMLASTNLNAGQKSGVEMILTTTDRFVGVQGLAGVGKSHTLSQAVEAIKEEAMKSAHQQGYEIIGLAPYASQNKALAELGMESQTLTSFLVRADAQARLGPKAIVFLDEASVVPVHQMRELMTKVEAAGARLVQVGDLKQTQAVEAGKPFQQLQENGMTVAYITDIQRQQNAELKAAVVSAANGNIGAAVKHLESRTVQIVSAEKRHQEIATRYAALPEPDRQKTLIVAGTNEARQSINQMVRAELKLTDDQPIKTLDSVDMTRAEKKVAGSYTPGQVLVLEGQRSADLVRGHHYDIVAVSNKENQVVVRGQDGKDISIDPSKLRGLSIYTKQTLPLAKGDWVRLTRNNTNLGVANGERYQIEKISKDAVTLSNGVKLPRAERLHMQYGYATTVNSAQGLTTDRVMIDADTKSLTSNRAVFYVAISRPRHELFVFTDSKKKLAEVMSREPKKFAALELRSDDLEKKMVSAALQRQALSKSLQKNTEKSSKATLQR
jgi:conjugative relaxase-like TrwC/TraI family protein